MLDDLRAAMAAETADLAVAPDLAERVEHRVRRRRWRTRLTAALLPFLAAAGWFLIPQFAGTQAVPPDQVIDGVQVGYVPPGLSRHPPEGPLPEEFRCRCVEWSTHGSMASLFHDGGWGASVAVHRGERVREILDAYEEDTGGPVTVRERREMAGHRGLYSEMRDGSRMFLWIAEPGLAVEVTTIRAPGPELEKIVEGISVP
ncbi:hypothetical protein [Herbidospora cretacea]|uniref:hypothetical protein n=1 Tax=Herbidospora cretacea TaxID=28444 RepID=UPI0004C46329|nr:hypothetical protein [Herbidospora cretacea]